MNEPLASAKSKIAAVAIYNETTGRRSAVHLNFKEVDALNKYLIELETNKPKSNELYSAPSYLG